MDILPIINLLIRLLHSHNKASVVSSLTGREIERKGTYFGPDFHTIPQVDSQLPDIPKGMLVCRSVVYAEYLRCGVLH